MKYFIATALTIVIAGLSVFYFLENKELGGAILALSTPISYIVFLFVRSRKIKGVVFEKTSATRRAVGLLAFPAFCYGSFLVSVGAYLELFSYGASVIGTLLTIFSLYIIPMSFYAILKFTWNERVAVRTFAVIVALIFMFYFISFYHKASTYGIKCSLLGGNYCESQLYNLVEIKNHNLVVCRQKVNDLRLKLQETTDPDLRKTYSDNLQWATNCLEMYGEQAEVY